MDPDLQPAVRSVSSARSARKARRKKAHREHRPHDLGPRVFQRGPYFYVDLRFLGGGRVPLLNPQAHGWPNAGERTTSEEVARRWAHAYHDLYRQEERRKQLGLKGPSPALGVEVQRFLDHQERTAAVRTRLSNGTALATHLVPFLGPTRPVESIEKEDLQTWVNALGSRGYAPGTVAGYLAVARRFFRWRSEAKHDPTHGVALPNRGERDVMPLDDAEIAALRKAADALDAEAVSERMMKRHRRAICSYRLALECALATGCRLGELPALEWSAIDASERTIRVRAQLAADGHGTALQPLKGRRSRTALILPSWWAFHNPAGVGRILLADGVLSISHRSAQHAFIRLFHRAGITQTGRCVHACRHTYAKTALEMGARLEELQMFLGHSSISTTEKYYAWLTAESATTLARGRIYNEPLRLVKPTPVAKAARG